MGKKPATHQESDEDNILWQRVTQQVTPLPGRRYKTPSRMSDPILAEKRFKLEEVSEKISQTEVLSPVTVRSQPVDLRLGDRAGLDGRTQRRLFRGDVAIDRRLDLHGLTAAQAQIKLNSFIEDAAYSGCRCVLVITGKGAGVLRNYVPEWLKRPPLMGMILALAEARQADGGSGAYYVLIRRRRG